MLKQDLTLQILKQADHYLKEKIKKVIALMKDELGRKIMKELVILRARIMMTIKEQKAQKNVL